MQSHEMVAQAKREVQEFARSLVQQVVFWSKVSASSADGTGDGVEGWPGGDGDPSGQMPVRRGEPWGVHGRPKTGGGVQALVARVMGGEAAGVITAIWTGSYGRQNLAEGETQIYNLANGCEIYLDKNGAMFVTVASGQIYKLTGGSDFMLLGNTYRNAEHTFNQALQTFFNAMATAWTAQATGWTAMATFFSALAAALPATAPAAGPAGVAATAAATASSTAATASSTAATAAGTMESGASSFLSQIAKVG